MSAPSPHATSIEKLQEQIKRCQKNEKRIMEEYRELNQEVVKLRKYEHAVEKEKNEVIRLTKHLENRDSLILKNKKEIESSKKRIEELEGLLAGTKTKMFTETNSLAKQVKEISDKYDLLKSINEQREKDLKRLESMTMDMKKMRLEKEQLTHQLGDMKGQKMAALKQKDEIEQKLRLEVSDHNCTKAALNGQIEEGTELESEVTELQKSMVQFKMLQLNHEKLMEELKRQKKQAEMDKNIRQALMKDNRNLIAMKEEMGEKIFKMEQEWEKQREKQDIQAKEMDRQESEARNQAHVIKVLQETLRKRDMQQQQLEQKDHQMSSRALLKDKEIIDLRSQIKDMEIKQRVLNQEKESLELQVTYTEKDLCKTRELHRNAQNSMEDLTKRNNGLLCDCRALEEKLAKVMANFNSAKEMVKESNSQLQHAEMENENLLNRLEKSRLSRDKLTAKAMQQEEQLNKDLRQCKNHMVELQEKLNQQQSTKLTLEDTLVKKEDQIKLLGDLLNDAREKLSWFEKKFLHVTLPGCIKNPHTRGKKLSVQRGFLKKCSVLAKNTEVLQQQSNLITYLQQKLARRPEGVTMELHTCKWDIRALKKKLQAKEGLNEVFFSKIKKMESENTFLNNEVRKLKLELHQLTSSSN